MLGRVLWWPQRSVNMPYLISSPWKGDLWTGFSSHSHVIWQRWGDFCRGNWSPKSLNFALSKIVITVSGPLKQTFKKDPRSQWFSCWPTVLHVFHGYKELSCWNNNVVLEEEPMSQMRSQTWSTPWSQLTGPWADNAFKLWWTFHLQKPR